MFVSVEQQTAELHNVSCKNKGKRGKIIILATTVFKFTYVITIHNLVNDVVL